MAACVTGPTVEAGVEVEEGVKVGAPNVHKRRRLNLTETEVERWRYMESCVPEE